MLNNNDFVKTTLIDSTLPLSYSCSILHQLVPVHLQGMFKFLRTLFGIASHHLFIPKM